MKQTIILSNKHADCRQKRTPAGICLSFIAAAFLLLVLPNVSHAQQFVKTYKPFSPCTQTNGNLVLNSITRTKKTAVTFYVAGIQDSAVYVAEMDAMGVVLQEKLLGVNSKNYSLRSMITDDDGNLVLAGSMNNSPTSPTLPVGSFLMKVNPALNLLWHHTYRNTAFVNYSTVFFNDLKDNKAAGQYYICGSTRPSNTANDVLLLKADRNTGNITSIKKGNAGEDSYDALVFPRGKIDSSSQIIATGRLSHIGTSTFRPWINLHDNNLNFLQGRRYIQAETTIGRLYSTSLVNDDNLLAYCWVGDLVSTRTGINTGLSVFNEPSTLTSSLLPVWQAEYTFTPVMNTRKFLNKIAAEPKGYVAEGQWSDNTTTSPIDGSWIGEMFFLRTDKNGTPIWSRRLKNVQVMQTTHNAAFVIEGNSIYAVGFKQNTSSTEGVLVRIPLSDGAMDTSCAPLQLAVAKKIQYSAPETVANLDFKVQDSLYYYPINCTKTDTTTNCNQPCTDTVKLNADFALYGYLPTGSPSYFQVFANSFSPSPNSKWIVSQTTLVGPSYLDVPTTVYASSTGGTWATATTTQFGGYNGTVGPITESNTPTPTSFAVNQRYRFKHILSYTNHCGIVKTDTVVKNIFMCPSCKGNKLVVEAENESSTGERHTVLVTKNSISETEINVRLMPNPVSGSTITLEYAAQNNSPVLINIQDMQGRKLVGKQFTSNAKTNGRYTMDVSSLPNGSYAMIIANNGKTITQKFVVAK